MAQHPDHAASTPSAPPATWPVWATLVAAPMILGLAFLPVIAWMAGLRGLRGPDLLRAVEQVAAVPATVGFGLILLLTWRMARRDQLSHRTLGWRRPLWTAVLVGIGCGLLIATLNQAWLYPLIQRFQPGFDPSLGDVPLIMAALMMGVAIVAEDTLYRGYALVQLQARHGVGAAVGICSLFYALLTPGPELALKVWALGFGLVLSALRLWTGSLWPVVLAHLIVSLGPRAALAFTAALGA